MLKKEFDLKAFGKRLAYMRRKLGLKQKDLADLTGRTASAVSAWEIGKGIMPVDIFAKLVKIYGVNPLWLLFGDGPMFLSDVTTVDRNKEFGEDIKSCEIFEIIKKLNLQSAIEDLIKGSEYYARVGMKLREILEKINTKE